MFRTSVFFACFCLFMNGGFAQGIWSQLNSNSASHFKDIEFVDLDRGFTVGTNGTLLRTTDGGLVWDSIPLPTSSDLNALDFPTAARGYLVGEDGAALQSSDSGATWVPMNLPASYHYHDLSFLDANLGWVIGRDTFDAMLFKTTDGGQSWQSYREPGYVISTPQGFGADYDWYEKILVVAEDDVYVGGYNYTYGGASEYRPFVREFDTGLNMKPTGFYGNQGYLSAGVNGLANPRQDDIEVMLNRGMPTSSSSSYGNNWFIRSTGATGYPSTGSSAHEFDDYICLHFSDSMTAYVSRYTQADGYGVYQSDGGGTNYTDLSYPGAERILAIDFPTQGVGEVGYFAGSAGTIYKYEKAVSVPPVEPVALLVYPNPMQDRMKIQFSGGAVTGSLMLFDLTGRQVQQYSFERRSDLNWEVTDLPNGVYTLRVETDRGMVYTKKVQILSR